MPEAIENPTAFDYGTWIILLIVVLVVVFMNLHIVQVARLAYSSVTQQQLQTNECASKYFEYETARYKLAFDSHLDTPAHAIKDAFKINGTVDGTYRGVMIIMWLEVAVVLLCLGIYFFKSKGLNMEGEGMKKSLLDGLIRCPSDLGSIAKFRNETCANGQDNFVNLPFTALFVPYTYFSKDVLLPTTSATSFYNLLGWCPI